MVSLFMKKASVFPVNNLEANKKVKRVQKKAQKKSK